MNIIVAQSDISTLAVDAIVVPCNSQGEMSVGIRNELGKLGEPMEVAFKKKAPIAVGAAMVTEATGLGASNAIMVPIVKHEGDEIATELLRRAVKAALIAANMKRYESLALPSMISDELVASVPGGHTGPTVAEAARAVVQEIRQHQKPFPETVYLIGTKDKMVRIFNQAVEYARNNR